MHNGNLRITGLTVGEPLSIYSATGALVYQSVVTDSEVEIRLNAQGVYIVSQGDYTVRVAFD